MKLELIRKLFAPVNYLRIKHEDKFWIDWVFPLLLALSVVGIVVFLPGYITLVGKDGFIDQLNGLLQILTGFYIAALAAVSTFDSKGMDELMEGEPPIIYEKRRGVYKRIPLTRRRFLCYLFGYLALLCFVMFTLGLIVNLLVPAIDLSGIFGNWWSTVRYLMFFAYVFILSNMVTTTLLGLYYLTVKIHIHKPERHNGDQGE